MLLCVGFLELCRLAGEAIPWKDRSCICRIRNSFAERKKNVGNPLALNGCGYRKRCSSSMELLSERDGASPCPNVWHGESIQRGTRERHRRSLFRTVLDRRLEPQRTSLPESEPCWPVTIGVQSNFSITISQNWEDRSPFFNEWGKDIGNGPVEPGLVVSETEGSSSLTKISPQCFTSTMMYLRDVLLPHQCT